MLRARGRARSGLRARPLGDRLRDRAELQQAVGGVRPGRPRGVAREGVRRGRGGARLRGPRGAGRAGARRGAREPLPGQRPVGRPRRMERRLRRRHACRLSRASRRPRRRGALRRRADEPHAVGAVGSLHGPAARGRGDARGQGGARARARTSRRPRPPGARAPLRAPDGDVAVPRAGAAGRGRAAVARPRRRPPRAHADAHRRAVRRLQEHARLEPEGDRGQREVRRAGGPGRVLRALSRPRPSLRDLRGAVPRPVAGRAPRRRRPRGLAARGAAADRAAADGRLPRGVRPHAAARAHPLRAVGGHPRAPAARRPRASTAPRRR